MTAEARGRAWRRTQAHRIKRRVARYRHVVYMSKDDPDYPRVLGSAARTPKRCSCSLCANDWDYPLWRKREMSKPRRPGQRWFFRNTEKRYAIECNFRFRSGWTKWQSYARRRDRDKALRALKHQVEVSPYRTTLFRAAS